VTKTVYIAAAEAKAGKSIVALGMIARLKARGERVGIFRPLVSDPSADPTASKVLAQGELDQDLDSATGVSYQSFADKPDKAISELVAKFGALRENYDTLIVIGSDYDDVSSPVELTLNARIATNLDCPVIAMVPARDKNPEQMRRSAKYIISEIRHYHNEVIGLVGSHVEYGKQAEVLAALDGLVEGPVNVFPDVDIAALLQRVSAPRKSLRTQHRFEYEIMAQARADRQTIVLPESEDARILTAASILLERDVANLVLLGEKDEVQAHAAKLGVDISKAEIKSMNDTAAVEKYATKLAELRAAKGMTIEKAREEMKDSAFFGTMMVYMGDADGMVSGACHTTANTIRPALQTVKTKPGVKVVSGSFFMCMADQVWLFADCAVNPNPTPADLADIAISSADTAAAFGIEPRVAMISYSTGTSGAGPSVDAVVEAVRLVEERRPDIALAGPIQFDAAVDPTVGERKMPGNPVAGQATVFVFPDLNCGNAVYKGVQRTSGAVAVGPVLQGLNKPITDLSRGANVDDIVSTVAITAVQAQSM
jgi:phosphate acetyltransferase